MLRRSLAAPNEWVQTPSAAWSANRC